MIRAPERKVRVHWSCQDCLSLSSVLQAKCCKGQKNVPCPPVSATLGHRHCSHIPFPHLPKLPRAPKAADSGKFQRQGAVRVVAGQEGSAGQRWGRCRSVPVSLGLQPTASSNASTPPTFWPGTEPYVCSL